MADSMFSTIQVGGYGLLNIVTAITSLVAWIQSRMWTAGNCSMGGFVEPWHVPISEAPACHMGRWFVYMMATMVALLGAYIALLILSRKPFGDVSAWRPVASGISFSLVTYLVLLWVGWFPITENSITGTFLRDTEISPTETAWPKSLGPLFPGPYDTGALRSGKASIVLIHLTILWGAYTLGTALVARDTFAEDDTDKESTEA